MCVCVCGAAQYGKTKMALYQCIPTQLAKNLSTALMEEVIGAINIDGSL